MANEKDYLTNMANETISIIKNGFYINKNRKKILLQDKIQQSVADAELLEFKNINNFNIKGNLKNIRIVSNSTVDTIIDIRKENKNGNIIALNFASAKHPGGGFLRGTIAQEESIARSSTMYSSLIKYQKEFYDYHINNLQPLYTDKMIYSPNVLVIRNNKGELLDEPIECSIITSPAVNATIAKERNISNEEIYKAMKTRIEKIIELAIMKNPDTLILGAYGCGVFGNKVEDVAKIFYEVLNSRYDELKNMDICFAIYDKTNETINKFEKELMKDE